MTHDAGPLLIVAGAGTGKTTVITQRLGWLIETGKAKGDEILALTFTDKAAGEMEERADKLLPYGYLDLWISTFHSFAEKILKENALEIGLPNDFKLLNQTQQWLLVRQNLDKFDLDYYRPLGNPTKFIHALIKLFSRAKDEVISPADYLKYVKDLKLNSDSADFLKNFLEKETIKALSKKERKELAVWEIKKAEEAANAFHIYQQLLLENNALDFGDLINYCLELFRKRPMILAKYRQQFKYILVDEFQDTNYAQYELVKLLAAPRNNITVVGDDDQAIYKFRGASVSNILEFKKDFPQAKEVFLNRNYRSVQEILDLSYKFIQQNNPDRLEVKLAKSFEPRAESLKPKAPLNFVRGRQSPKPEVKNKKEFILSKKLIAQNKNTGLIIHLPFETINDEARGVLKQIVDLKEKDKAATWSDFAILSRTNDVANYFVSVIAQTQIPYQFLASVGLYHKPVILDILAYLKLLDNYHEGPAMFRVLNFSVFNVTLPEINNLQYWAYKKGCSLFQAMQTVSTFSHVHENIREKFNKISGQIEKHSRLALEKPIGEVVIAFLEDTGYLAALTKSESVESVQAVNYLNQFYKKITDFENSFADQSVKNFLQLVELEMEAGDAGALLNNLEEGPDSVKIMTVHAAKGLEFKYVFLVNLVDRRFPTGERRDPIELPDSLIKEILPEGDAHLQEERRLFYVAATRAKIGLFFTSAYDCGGARRKKLSPFLLELKNIGFKIQEEKTKAGDGLLAQRREKIGGEIREPEPANALPPKFSFTQLKAFETCPYQYRFAHILHVPVRGKASFSFGKSIHSTLQRFFDLIIQRSNVVQVDLFGNKIERSEIGDQKSDFSGKVKKNNKVVVSLDELLEIYDNAWIDDWYVNQKEQAEYKQKGKKTLVEFYKTLADKMPRPKYLERPFNLKISADGEEYSIKGTIDRVDVLDGGIEIIDYKTGRGKTEKTLVADDKDQLLIYQLAAEQVLVEKVKQLSFYYLEPNVKISFLGRQKDLDNLREKIVNIIREIKKGKFLPKPGMMCQFCDFKNICEFRDL